MPGDEEQPQLDPREQLVKEKSMTMEYFLESRNLDKITEEMLKKYDKDGDGAFSKDEVVSIIIDLRNEHVDNDKLSATNRLYKRLLVTAVILCILLLAGMFALSYAVAALTAKTDVAADGTLVAIGTTDPISTDSRAEVHILPANEDGLICVTHDEAEVMLMETDSGRNVMMDTSNADGSQRVVQLSGAGTYTRPDGSFCWVGSGGGGTYCYVSSDKCHDHDSAGRRLSHWERSELELVHGRPFRHDRFLSDHNGLIQSQTATDSLGDGWGSCGGKDDGYCCNTNVNNYCESLGLDLSGGDLNCKSNDLCMETD